MLELQKLKSEWNNEEIVFVSINGRDDPTKEQLKSFLHNRKIDLNSAYFGETVANAYNVKAYPSIYIIGKDGKIIYNLDGYTSSLKNDLTTAIKGK